MGDFKETIGLFLYTVGFLLFIVSLGISYIIDLDNMKYDVVCVCNQLPLTLAYISIVFLGVTHHIF